MGQVRTRLKKDLIRREYSKAFENLESNSSDYSVLRLVKDLKSQFQKLEQDFNQNKINEQTYYYSISKIVMNILQVADSIEKEEKEDWDFIDQLNNSLKLNLIKPDIDRISSLETDEFPNKSQSLFLKNDSEERIEKLKKKLNELADMLQKYESMKAKAESEYEIEKYHNIVEGLKFQIYQDSKELKHLTEIGE